MPGTATHHSKQVSIHARHCWRANLHSQGSTRPLMMVSIHARHCWRANPPQSGGRSRCQEVSIHARHCWRANPFPRCGQLCFCVVSIHARHCWRANQQLQALGLGDELFQSTPAIAGGRIQAAQAAREQGDWFQSTPAIAGGRIRSCRGVLVFFVGFNPRPPLLAGESPSHVTPCQAMVFSGACANLAMPSCVCMKNHRQAIRNRIKTRCCEGREPPGEKPFTGGSRRLP